MCSRTIAAAAASSSAVSALHAQCHQQGRYLDLAARAAEDAVHHLADAQLPSRSRRSSSARASGEPGGRGGGAVMPIPIRCEKHAGRRASKLDLHKKYVRLQKFPLYFVVRASNILRFMK